MDSTCPIVASDMRIIQRVSWRVRVTAAAALLSSLALRGEEPEYYFTTLAGSSEAGSADGVGSAARFNAPGALAIDAAGNVYVADTTDLTIRKIAPDGRVTTLAGAVGQRGYVNGAGSAARFLSLSAMTMGADGNLYVIENGRLVRKISPAGVVSTVAGADDSAGTSNGARDGRGTAARFWSLTAIAAAPDGGIWVAENGTSTLFNPFFKHWAPLRRIGLDGEVTTGGLLDDAGGPHTVYRGLAFDADGTVFACDTLYQGVFRGIGGTLNERYFTQTTYTPEFIALDGVGQAYVTLITLQTGRRTQVARMDRDFQIEVIGGTDQAGLRNGFGSEARFGSINGLAVDLRGTIYLSCSDHTIRKGAPASAPVIITQPARQTVSTGSAVHFSVQAAAVPEPTYQWYRDNAPISGATAASHSFAAANSFDAGAYSVRISNVLGSVTSERAELVVSVAPVVAPGNPGISAKAGGGGAPSAWFLALLGAVTALRGRSWLG